MAYRNDLMARWSVSHAVIRRKLAKPKPSQRKKEPEDMDEVSFWPGGRLKTHGEDIEAEYTEIKNWQLTGARVFAPLSAQPRARH